MKLFYKVKYKIKSLFVKPSVAPSYETKRATLNEYKERYGLTVLVETGTFRGDMILAMLDDFRTLYSIELHPKLHGLALIHWVRGKELVPKCGFKLTTDRFLELLACDFCWSVGLVLWRKSTFPGSWELSPAKGFFASHQRLCFESNLFTQGFRRFLMSYLEPPLA